MAPPRMSLKRFRSLYFVRPREWQGPQIRHRFGMMCGHAGYITGLFEYVMTDMLWLRIFAFAGCALIVGYQAVQPKIQWVSTSWNTIFCAMNLYHIRLLRRAQPRKLVEDELELHQVLGEHLASTSHVLSLLQEGVWQTLAPGSVIVEEGRTTEEMQVLIIVRGGCDIYIKGFRMGRLQPGSAVGFELAALRALEGGGSRESDEEGRGAAAAATIVVDDHSEGYPLGILVAAMAADPAASANGSTQLWLERLSKMQRRAKSWESDMNEELRQFQGELAGVLSLADEVAAERKASQQSTEVPVEELLQLRKEMGRMKGFLLEICEMLQESQEREAELKETQATTLKQARAKLRDSESELQEKQAKLLQREADFERSMQDKEREFQQTARQQQVREKELRHREVAVAEREKDKEREFQQTAREQQLREQELCERERAVLQREKEVNKRPLASAMSPGPRKVAQTPEDIVQVSPQRPRAKERQLETPPGPAHRTASREVPAQIKRKKRTLSDYKSQDEQRWGWYQSAERKRESATTEPLSQPQAAQEVCKERLNELPQKAPRKQGRPEAALEVRHDVAERPIEQAPAGNEERGIWASVPEQPEDQVPEESVMPFHTSQAGEGSEASGEEQEELAKVPEDSIAPLHSRPGQEIPEKGFMTLDLGELLDAVSKGLDPLEVEQTKRQKGSQEVASAQAPLEGDEDLSEPEAPEEIDWSCDEEVEELPQAVSKPKPAPPSEVPQAVPKPKPAPPSAPFCQEDVMQPPAEDLTPEPARLQQLGPSEPLVMESAAFATTEPEEDLNTMPQDARETHVEAEDAADRADVHETEESQELPAEDDGAPRMEEASPAKLVPPEPVLTGRQKKQKWMEKKFPGLPAKGASKGGQKGHKQPRADARTQVLPRPWPKLGSSRPPVVRRLLPKEEWAYRPLPTRRVVEGYSKALLKEFAQLNQLPDIDSLLPAL
eukprot:s3248_g3.t3